MNKKTTKENYYKILSSIVLSFVFVLSGFLIYKNQLKANALNEELMIIEQELKITQERYSKTSEQLIISNDIIRQIEKANERQFYMGPLNASECTTDDVNNN